MKKFFIISLFLMASAASVMIARPLLDDDPEPPSVAIPVTVIKTLKPIPKAVPQSIPFTEINTNRQITARVRPCPEGLIVTFTETLAIHSVLVRNLSTGEAGAARLNDYVDGMILSFPLTSGQWEIVLKCEGFERYRAGFIFDESLTRFYPYFSYGF